MGESCFKCTYVGIKNDAYFWVMATSNFERMVQLAEDVFASRTDPDQLSVDEGVISRLQMIHPSTMSEYNEGNGPVAWILVFPTTLELMNRFLAEDISEKELFELTTIVSRYEAIYLCSALVLEEYRGRGIAKDLTLLAIEKIKKDYPIRTLFVWAFSKEGAGLAEKLAVLTGLPLQKR
jgi:predicted GNAT family acetyltransferase